MIPIHEMRCGQMARVGHIVGCTENVRRMEEMGVRQGTQVTMLCKSLHPTNENLSLVVVRTGGTRMAFRPSDLLGILVA